MYPNNPNSVIPRSRAERKKLGMERSTATRVAAAPPSPKPEPVTAAEPDIVDELLQETPKTLPPIVEKKATEQETTSETPKIKKKPVKKKAAKKSTKKKATSRGKNVKVEELNQEELSDLFSGPTGTVDDDDDE